MKRLLSIFTLLCMSIVGWATQYCGETITANDGVSTAVLTCTNPTTNTYVMTITSDNANFSGLRGDNMWCHINGNGSTYHMTDSYTWDADSKTITFTITSTAVPDMYTPLYLDMGGEMTFTTIQNQTFEWPVSCGGDSKTVSDLTCTSATSLTLDPSGTSSITYSTSSTGVVTFSSSDESVATVSSSGVVTAVSAGVATITVSQAADATYNMGRFTVTVNVNMAKKASGKGYGSLILKDVNLYDWDGNFAGSAACGKIDLYVLTYGNKLVYKAVVKDGKTFENCTNYFCQLRTWKSDLTEMREQWALTCSDDLTTRYLLPNQTDNAPGLISAYGDEIKLTSYMVISGCGARTMKTVSYTRDYVNNYNASDVTAPVLGSPSITSGTDDITITLPAVTSEEVFYMIEDEEHGKRFFSMQPSFVLSKDGSGITYNYSCYAIDYNGNASVAQNAEVVMPFSAIVNHALDKPCYSGASANNDYVPSKANDGSLNSRWSPGAVANAEDAWWAVDLGADYNLSSIDIFWEGAYSDNFIIYGATDKPSTWNAVSDYPVALVTNTVQPTVGQTEDKVNSYSVSDHARYLLFMPSHLANNEWGASFWEFRVYSTGIYVPGAGEDTEKPVISAATLNSKSHDRAVIDITASDNVGVIKVRVVDADNDLNQDVVPDNGQIVVTGLTETTSYHLTLKAYDAANNASDAFTLSAFTTDADPTIPQVAAPAPVSTNKEIRPIYSDAFTSILAHSFDKDGWEGTRLYTEKNIENNKCLVYDVSSTKYLTWGMYDNGANAIIAADGYHTESYQGVDASEMEFMHLDIWSLQACNNILICINDQTAKTRLSHSGNGWQQYDLSLSDFNVSADEAKRTDNVRWLKFNDFTTVTGKVAIDNVYFWKYTSDLKSVVAQSNNASMGTAEAKVDNESVTSVESGTEVTFVATPNSGYLFQNWTDGSTIVSTQATYVATISTHTTLTANFRAIGTNYCLTEMEKNGHTAYVTMKRSGEGEYQLIVRSNEQLTNYGGVAMKIKANNQEADLRNQGVLSDDDHVLTATFEAEIEPVMNTPLYVVIRGVGEVPFDKLTNIEYEIPCDDNASVTSVTISRTTASVAVGDEFDLTAQVVPAFAANKSITWASDNTSVATVTSAGHVTTLAEGTAHITATSVDGGYTATCTVTVNAELETQTYWGNGSKNGIAIAYSITRNSDYTLTFVLEVLHQKTGFVPEVNYPGEENPYHSMAYDEESQTYSHTTTLTFSDGNVINGFFWLKYQGGVEGIDYSYTVGSSSEQEAYIPIEFKDNATDASWIDENNGQTRDVEIDRPMAADSKFKTLCLPFSMNAAQIAETFGECEILRLKEARMKSETDMYVGYERVSAIEAGYPYLITILDETKSKLDFTAVTINSATTYNTITVNAGNGKGVEMIGTFMSVQRNADTEFYLDASDNLLHSIGLYCSASGSDYLTIPAFRCYFRLVGFEDPTPVRARVMRMPEIATGIENTMDSNASTKQLIDGQLFIIRNGNRYTVTGIKVE